MKLVSFYITTFIAIIIVLDISISYTNIDVTNYRSHFYYIEEGYNYEEGRELFRASKDTEVLYELIPNASVICTNCTHPKEKETNKIKISVNPRGNRTTLYQPNKFQKKILFVGGSNTYGASVSDEYTIASLMQKSLNEYRENYYRVENLGMNALVMSQKISILEQYITKKGLPDIIFLQHSNKSRRAFFYKDEQKKEKMNINRELYLENYAAPDVGSLIEVFFGFFASYSALYRIAYSELVQFIMRNFSAEDCNINNFWKNKNNCTIKKLMWVINGYGIRLSEKKLGQFLQKYGEKTKIIIINPTYQPNFCVNQPGYTVSNYESIPGVEMVLHCNPRVGSEYQHIHPPVHVYKWYLKNYLKYMNEAELL